MKQWMKGGFLYYIAGALLVLAYSLLWFLDTPAGVQLLRYVGGAILVVGIILVFLPKFVFRSKGKPEKKRIGPRPQLSLTQESTLLLGIRSIWVGYSCMLHLFS